MNNKKNITEGLIFDVLNYVSWFFLSNLYFALLNIPLLFLLYVSQPPISIKPSLITIFLCLLPLGPAFAAELSVMGNLVREKDINVTRDFFKMYKLNFIQALLLWSIELAALMILFVDISVISSPLRYLFIFLLTFVFLLGLYLYPILSRFYMKSLDIFKLSFRCVFKYFRITLLNISILILALAAFYLLPRIFIFFIVSLVCYSIMFYENNILKDIEIALKPYNNSTEVLDE